MASTHSGTNVAVVDERRQGGIEDEGADAVRVTVGVASADAGAIGDAKKRDRLLAEGCPSCSMSLDHVLGADERQQLTVFAAQAAAKARPPASQASRSASSSGEGSSA